MKKITLASAALIVLAAALPGAAEESKKPGTSMTTGAAQQANRLGLKTPFNVWPDGNWIFVVNAGNSDWKAPLDVHATCVPVAPTTSCGSNFPGGKFHAHYDTFPAGHGNAPIKGSANAQQISGPGWIAVLMGLPAGSYKITASAASNSSAEANVTIASPPSGNTIQVQPGVVPVVKPTKTP